MWLVITKKTIYKMIFYVIMVALLIGMALKYTSNITADAKAILEVAKDI